MNTTQLHTFKLRTSLVPPRLTQRQTIARHSVKVLAGLRSNKDPYSVLGVKPGATEEQIKVAHRKLVKQHHPDVKQGDLLAHSKFLSIQEAYELLTGKRRGKEVDSTPSSRSGWDFHDWYWKFSMKRRKNGFGSSTTSSTTGDAPPPPPSEEAFRQNWKSQLSGLRHKAASKRANSASRYPNGRRAEDGYTSSSDCENSTSSSSASSRYSGERERRNPSTAAASSVWRSTTKNARTPTTPPSPQEQQQQHVFSSTVAHVATTTTSAHEEDAATTTTSFNDTTTTTTTHTVTTNTTPSPVQPPQHYRHHPESQQSVPQQPNQQQQEEQEKPLHHAFSAVRQAHLRHNTAVHTHVKAAVSQIVEFTHRIRTSLNTDEVSARFNQLNKFATVGSSGSCHSTTTTTTTHAKKQQQYRSSDHGYHQQHHHHTTSTSINIVNNAVTSFGSRGDAHSTTTHEQQNDGGEYSYATNVYDSHSRKFADRGGVEERLTHQLAGLKRRAALKNSNEE